MTHWGHKENFTNEQLLDQLRAPHSLKSQLIITIVLK